MVRDRAVSRPRATVTATAVDVYAVTVSSYGNQGDYVARTREGEIDD